MPKMREHKVARDRDCPEGGGDLSLQVLQQMQQNSQNKGGSIRRKSPTENEESKRKTRTTRSPSIHKQRLAQCMEVTKKIEEGSWWPFDRVDPEILAMVKLKSSKLPEQHQEAPF